MLAPVDETGMAGKLETGLANPVTQEDNPSNQLDSIVIQDRSDGGAAVPAAVWR
jgi:hypothetical protein